MRALRRRTLPVVLAGLLALSLGGARCACLLGPSFMFAVSPKIAIVSRSSLAGLTRLLELVPFLQSGLKRYSAIRGGWRPREPFPPEEILPEHGERWVWSMIANGRQRFRPRFSEFRSRQLRSAG